MKIDKELVVKLADLAQLKLKESEINMFSQQLSEIVSFVEKLKEVKAEEIEEKKLSSLDDISRDDIAINSRDYERELSLEGAKCQSGLIQAPKIR